MIDEVVSVSGTSDVCLNEEEDYPEIFFFETKQLDQSCLSSFVIRESSLGRKMWELSLLVMLLYIGVIFPYRLAFLHFRLRPDSETPCVDYEDPPGWTTWETIVDIFFWMDLVLNFFFTYRNIDNEEETKLGKIWYKYLTGFFLLNLLACLPQGVFKPLVQLLDIDPGGCQQDFESSSVGYESTAALNDAVRLTRLQRVTRLARLGRLLRLVRILRFFNRFMSHTWKDRISGLRCLNWLCGLAFAVHLLACGWYMCAALHTNHVDTWVGRRDISDATSPEGIINLRMELPQVQWVHALYFVLTVFTTVGFGDMYAFTTGEIFYVLFVMLLGTIVQSIVVGEMITIITDALEPARERSEIKKLMQGFAVHVQLERKFTTKLDDWIDSETHDDTEFDGRAMRKLLTSGTIPRTLLGQMPEQLYNGKFVKNRFLTTLSMLSLGGTPPRFALLLSTMLRARTYKAGDIIFEMYDHSFNILFVMSGVFACVGNIGPDGASDAVGRSRRPSIGSGRFEPFGNHNSGVRTTDPPEQYRRYSSKQGEISSMLDQETSAWTPESSDEQPWLQIDLGSPPRPVCGICFKGHPTKEQWVTACKVKTSLSGPEGPWEEFTCNAGSTDKNTLAEMMFSTGTEARYVRVEPLSWHSKISMRVGVKVGNQHLSPYRIFGRQNWFGEELLAGGFHRTATVRCERDGEVMVLSKSDLMGTGGSCSSLFEEFPHFVRPLAIIARHRLSHRRLTLQRHPKRAPMPYDHLAAYHIQRFWRHRFSPKFERTGSTATDISPTDCNRKKGRLDLERRVNGLIDDVAVLQDSVTSRMDKIMEALESLTATAPIPI